MSREDLLNTSEADPEFEEKFGHLPPEIRNTYRASWRTQKANFQHADESKQILEGDGIRAGYKIEVHFGPDRTHKQEYKALVLVLESGKYLNGDGDDQMYLCMDRRIAEKASSSSRPSALPFLRATAKKDPHRIAGCGMPIPSQQVALGRAMCMTCKSMIDASWLTGQIPFYGSTHELAEMIELLFVRLKCNADIYCKYDPKDIRYEACQADRVAKLGAIKGLEEARRLRGLSIYPLRNILRDVGSGASLTNRFRAFLSA